MIDVIDRHIKYCTGCFVCKMNGGTCIHDDDMRAILDEILESDLLLFSFPLYCYGMPAPLKALLDRTMPLSSLTMQKVGDRYAHVGQADFSHLKYLMICGCGFPNSKHNFEPAIAQFRLCFLATAPSSPFPKAPCSTCPRRPSSLNQSWRLCGKRGSNTSKQAELMKHCSLKSVLP